MKTPVAVILYRVILVAKFKYMDENAKQIFPIFEDDFEKGGKDPEVDKFEWKIYAN